MIGTPFIVALAAFCHSLALAYPSPGKCSGYCFTHDPSVIRRDDGTYFRYSTRGGIEIVTSKNLAGPWTKAGSVMPSGSIIDMPGNKVLWAPDVSYMGGLYYLFYAVSTSGSQSSAIGYATSVSMDPGTWIDHGSILTSSNTTTPFNAIDPSLVKDGNTENFYLIWGSYWQQIYQSQAEIRGTEVMLTGDKRQVAHDPKKPQMEGAFIFENGGYYYLFLSVGDCCTYTPKPTAGDEYHINVCRSKSPIGPFVDKNNLSCLNGGGSTILASHDKVYAPGGQGIFRDPTLGDVLYYHYVDPNSVAYDDAKFGWNKMTWDSGWPTL
ncbi:putative extracellular endo-1,5-alpha-L-arabinase [Thozetella sp. PMI_491]|nr:putative extracellular endo-1,5-alpha-L-arabinase [Thozetella sp. PMI_491]